MRRGGKAIGQVLCMQAAINRKLDDLFPEPFKTVIIRREATYLVTHYIDPVSKLAYAEEEKLR